MAQKLSSSSPLLLYRSLSIVCLGDSITQRGWVSNNMSTPTPRIPIDSSDGILAEKETLKDLPSAGWVSIVSDFYARRADVVNRGYSGFTSRMVKRLVHEGSNDSAVKTEEYNQHVPIEEYSANLQNIIEKLIVLGGAEAHIIVMSPPPVSERMWGNHCNNDLKKKASKLTRLYTSTSAYASEVRSLTEEFVSSKEKKVEFLDVHEEFLNWGKTKCQDGKNIICKDENKFHPKTSVHCTSETTQYEQLLSDGLHLSSKGNNLLAQLVIEKIKSSWPNLVPSRLDIDVPCWREMI